MGFRTDYSGRTFGLLTIVNRLPKGKCVCTCACGATGVIKQYASVTNGSVKSCSCAWRAAHTKHGDAGNGQTAPEYRTWQYMRERCYNESYHYYHRYGGRGIKVCDEWRNDYSAFLAYVGRRPAKGYSLDRINNDGNYEPGNVRWATKRQQCRNTSRSRTLSAFGQTATIAEWSEQTGIRNNLIARRLDLGWTVERALSEPAGYSGAQAKDKKNNKASVLISSLRGQIKQLRKLLGVAVDAAGDGYSTATARDGSWYMAAKAALDCPEDESN